MPNPMLLAPPLKAPGAHEATANLLGNLDTLEVSLVKHGGNGRP